MTNEDVTLRDIAGFCPEEAIWRMLTDVTEFLLKDGSGYKITADTIAVIGEQFIVVGEKSSSTMSDMVWELGATAFYVAMGHEVFGGHGMVYQKEHPHVALPVLQKTFQSLTPILHRCLCYNSSDRISMESLRELTEIGLASCRKRQRVKKILVKDKEERVCYQVDKWPEKMIEV